MSSVLIVLPILTILMFDLGLGLKTSDFGLIFKRPKALLTGLLGQIIFLPALAFILATFFGLKNELFVGLMLIACCPGGSSSNIFTGIAKGDVALSVSLTAFSSLITMITLPLLMGQSVEMPVSNLVIQNLVLVLMPIIIGMALRKLKPEFSATLHHWISRFAFPALMFLAAVFFIVNIDIIREYFSQLFIVASLLVVLGMLCGGSLGIVARLSHREVRTLVIEVGMQNAAQAMALAASPFVFNNSGYAIPATVYALMMNIILLIYVVVVKRVNPDS
ncbi:MAG: bile acid:sodium symporter family protein [Bacteroides sp.]|nr:bile acid:sodium symporter family protein [Bacteroides sp.]MBD5359196.1 bile acid:sodium symporter family protein [Bacteroides sp.]MBD5364008.1 bile acid:sodium symporter family protein [Bacteroides sp.]MBD5372512.1 bile acid:sodium symporter family protein [Bacteroides sp.]MDE6033300.1 bile acid:sodium symporter family protein [Muribaculaceae bacterium]